MSKRIRFLLLTLPVHASLYEWEMTIGTVLPFLDRKGLCGHRGTGCPYLM